MYVNVAVLKETQPDVYKRQINGKSITLNIESAENERLLNKATTSGIEMFNSTELVVKSDSGETSTFVRI